MEFIIIFIRSRIRSRYLKNPWSRSRSFFNLYGSGAVKCQALVDLETSVRTQLGNKKKHNSFYINMHVNVMENVLYFNGSVPLNISFLLGFLLQSAFINFQNFLQQHISHLFRENWNENLYTKRTFRTILVIGTFFLSRLIPFMLDFLAYIITIVTELWNTK